MSPEIDQPASENDIQNLEQHLEEVRVQTQESITVRRDTAKLPDKSLSMERANALKELNEQMKLEQVATTEVSTSVFTRLFLDNILIGGLTNWLFPLLEVMGITVLFAAVLFWLQSYTLMRLSMKLSVKGGTEFFWHVLRLAMEFYAQRFAGEIGSRVKLNDTLARIVSGQLTGAALSVFLAFFYGIVLYKLDPVLTGFGIATMAINLIALQLITRRRVEQTQKLMQFSGKVMSTSMVGLQSIETIKANAGETDFFARWSGNHTRLLNAQQEMGSSAMVTSSIPQCSCN